MGAFWGKMRKGWWDVYPPTNSFLHFGLTSVQILVENRSRNASVRVHATNTRTEANWFCNLSMLKLYIGQMMTGVLVSENWIGRLLCGVVCVMVLAVLTNTDLCETDRHRDGHTQATAYHISR